MSFAYHRFCTHQDPCPLLSVGLYPPSGFQLLGEQGGIKGTTLRESTCVDPRRTGEPQYYLEVIRNVLKRIWNVDHANRWQK